MTDLHVFFDGECDWYVGESVDDVRQAYDEYTEIPPEEQDEMGLEWTQLPDDQVMPIHNDPDDEPITKTCAQWARENGRGFLCSTEW